MNDIIPSLEYDAIKGVFKDGLHNLQVPSAEHESKWSVSIW